MLSSKMKILYIGDIHIKDNDTTFNKFSKKILDVAAEESPDLIIQGGDLMDNGKKFNSKTLCTAIGFLSKLSEIAETVICVGNHEYMSNKNFDHSIHPYIGLSQWPRVTVADRTIMRTYRGFNLCFVPYIEAGKFMTMFSEIDISKIDVCFAHQEFEGSVFQNQGDPEPQFNVISGHIHEYRKMGRVLYPGTPLQVAFNESTEKTVSIFTLLRDGDSSGSLIYDQKVKVFERRIETNVVRKETVRVTPKDLFDLRGDRNTKYLIVGDSSEISHNDEISRLRREGSKISIQIRGKRRPPEIKRRRFLESLGERVSKDRNLSLVHKRVLELIQ